MDIWSLLQLYSEISSVQWTEYVTPTPVIPS